MTNDVARAAHLVNQVWITRNLRAEVEVAARELDDVEALAALPELKQPVEATYHRIIRHCLHKELSLIHLAIQKQK